MKTSYNNENDLLKNHIVKKDIPVAHDISNPVKNYQEYCRPKLSDMLNCLKLDVPYKKAIGNYLYYDKLTDKGIKETAVLDFVGGFGANVLGHNNPELQATLIDCINKDLPNLSQCSVRISSANLAQKLNELVPASGKYVCNFSNSGTEAVEAALKHAFKVRTDAIQRKHDLISTQLNAIRDRFLIDNQRHQLPDGYNNIATLTQDIQEHNLKELNYYLENPVICAYKSAFHGKTTSSLKVTFNKTFRESFEGMSALHTIFLDADKPDQLSDVALKQRLTFKYVELENELVLIKTWNIPRIFAFIMEIILGEGGILIQPDNVLAKLAVLQQQLNIPFIIDEIQTGCGRTGTFFAYEQTPLRGIEPEYITLSKALGGGLSKIGVTLIHEKEYDPEFGLIHTSTFAEDDMSSEVALKVIEILTRNEGKLMHEAVIKGDLIVNKLKHLQKKYPDIIKEIRGRGLMIGIEFTDLNNYGPFFRYAGSQGFIALLIASYALCYHDIRILSPLTTMFKGNPGKKRRPVIRIQPSVFISEEEVDRLIIVIDEVLNIISKNNEYILMAHLFHKELPLEVRLSPIDVPNTFPAQVPRTDIHGRIGFVVHITELRYLLEYYLTSFEFYDYKRRDLIKWWDNLCRFLDPDLMHRTYITSDNKTIEANIVCVPYLPKYMIRTYVEGLHSTENVREKEILLLDMQDKIQDAILKAKDLGDSNIPLNIVGLGAYNSIVTDNSLAINDNDIPVTTGNAYTTALVYMGVKEAVKQQKKDISSLTASIVGASGNIGSALTYLIGAEVDKIYIIGRDKVLSYDKLAKSRELCLTRILENIRLQINAGASLNEIKLKGFSFTIFKDVIEPVLLNEPENPGEASLIYDSIYGEDPISATLGKIMDEMIKKFYKTDENPFITVSGLEVIKDSDIVVLATNSSDTWLINPDDVKKGAVICCASVPSNLSETFKGKTSEYFVFDGGYALLPNNNEIDFVGMPKYGNVYGCLAETMLMGFEGTKSSFARGTITISHITKVIELAEKFGFKLGKYLLGDDIQRMVM